jgi:hypothetical protein
MHSYGLLDVLIEEGQAFVPNDIHERRFDGELLTKRPMHSKKWHGFDQ